VSNSGFWGEEWAVFAKRKRREGDWALGDKLDVAVDVGQRDFEVGVYEGVLRLSVVSQRPMPVYDGPAFDMDFILRDGPIFLK